MSLQNYKVAFEELKKPFHPDDIEWRPQKHVKNGNVKALAYVTARAVMDRFDDAVGPENWGTTLRPIDMGVSSKLDKNGNATEFKGFVCAIYIKVADEDGKEITITREDVSNLTDFESIKGGASGAEKRTAVQFGVGRYLYDLKDSWVQTDEYGAIKQAPRLPDWALPEGFSYGKTTSNQPKSQSTQNTSSDIKIDKDNLGNTVMPGGKYKDKKFKDIPYDYIEWMSTSIKNEALKQAATDYLKEIGTPVAGSEDAPW